MHGGHKVTQKRSPSFIFFVFDTGYLKFCINIELVILKNRMFFVFRISNFFGGKMTSQSWRQIFFLISMEHFLTVSERTCRKDLETEKISEICQSNQKLSLIEV